MTEYLVLRLYGPLAAWGEIAIGESRHSAMHPSKSALLGLLGAAVGIARDDDAAQEELAHGYRFGIKLECFGTLLRDFQTVQYAVTHRPGGYSNRSKELADPSRATLLSNREYLCDSVAIVAVEVLRGAPHDRDALQRALRNPHFPLFLGRKSCPLAAPLAPQKVSASSVREALDLTPQASLLALVGTHPQQRWPTSADQHVLQPGSAHYFWEEGMRAGIESTADVVRHDEPVSRRRWQFSARREWTGFERAELE